MSEPGGKPFERSGVTRRDALRAGAVAGAGAAAAFGAASAHAQGSGRGGEGGGSGKGSEGGDEALLLTNGRIHTVDHKNRVVEAVLVANGRFAAVGSEKSITKEFGHKLETVDLKRRTVIPGIIDSHIHIAGLGNRPGWSTLADDLFTIPEVIDRLRKRVADGVPADEFVTIIGPIAAQQFPEQRLPNLTELDAVPRMVLIFGASGGTWTNSAGRDWLTARGITVGADGSITGANVTATMILFRDTFQTPETRKRSSRDALRHYAGLGVTMHSDAGTGIGTPNGVFNIENRYTITDSFLALNRDGDLPARVRLDFIYSENDPATIALDERLRNTFPFFGDDWVRTGGIGEAFGPVPTDPLLSGSNTAWINGGLKVAAAGWRGETHSLNTSDFKAAIEGYEMFNAQHPIGELRWVVSHVPFITEDYVLRLKALGGGLKLGWGPLRNGTNIGPAYRMILGTGIPAGYHSDGSNISVSNPWVNFNTIITGRNLRGDLVNDGQQLTRQETLWLATRANKFFIREDDVGSIEVGNHADLAVLDRDYFKVADDDVKRIHSELTLVGGKVTHSSGAIRI
jgi:predicted amidohydrolase YtcJ